MLTVDGSQGEGGGQVLRTALGLSVVTGQAFRIKKVRAGRKKPGLMRQHLTAVRAAAEVSRASVSGDAIGSCEVTFQPRELVPGSYRFAVGTAGSATLVLQTVLPALMCAPSPSELVLEGGTHNPWAPPFDFLQKSLMPLLGRMGPQFTIKLDRMGFYPAGGGRFHVQVEPASALTPLELLERGELLQRRARAIVSKLPSHVARRELKVVHERLGWPEESLETVETSNSIGPGNILFLEMHAEHTTEVVTGFGSRQVRAVAVAEKAVTEARQYLASEAPVGKHLADQLLVPLSLAGGRFRTMAPSRHTTTNIQVIEQFLDIHITCEQCEKSTWEILVPAGL
jgi:RNA 3'-terminal phosphate cyclase (ATP)